MHFYKHLSILFWEIHLHWADKSYFKNWSFGEWRDDSVIKCNCCYLEESGSGPTTQNGGS